MIHFKELNENNYRECMRLKVKEHQLEFVSQGNYISLAKAFIFKETTFPYAIYIDNTMVGYIQYRNMELLGNYLLEKIMIDAKYQGKGYASQSMEKLIKELKKENKYQKLRLCVHKDNKDAIKLYHKFGFSLCNDEEEEEGEIVLGIVW